MTERDFAYWLQGYFEMLEAGHPESEMLNKLEPNQVTCIQKHINLVKTQQKHSFLIASVEIMLKYNVKDLRKILNNYFEHVIDPEHPNQFAAYNAHGKSKIRC